MAEKLREPCKERLHIRVTLPEKLYFQQVARRKRMTLTNLVKESLREYIKKHRR